VGDDQSLDIAVEDDLFRTVLFTILLGGFAALAVYFLYRFGTLGEGRSLLGSGAGLAACLACGALVARRRWWLRSLLVLASLAAAAVVVDQVVYYGWHERMDRVVTSLRQEIASGPPLLPERMYMRPTSFWIDPDQEVLLVFEPPLLAWTYRLDASSTVGHALVAGGCRALSRVTRGRPLDGLARTIVRPHQAYSVRVRSGEKTLSCQNDRTGAWTLSIETQPGGRARPDGSSRNPAGT